MSSSDLEQYLRDLPAASASVSAFDYAGGEVLSVGGDVVYHAASTIKIAVLAAVAAAAEEGRFSLKDRLHVRNRFLSVADGKPYRIEPGRDANADVQAARGKSMRIHDLARHMITTSSNLATNLLLELAGVRYAQELLSNCGVRGIELRRGVEDNAAFDAGMNNEVTTDGLVSLLRALLNQKFAGPELTEEMLEILAAQEFNSGIPSGLPSSVREQGRIAHKTGEISTVAHDAGIIFAPDRAPVVLAICTGWEPGDGGRMETVAGITARVWEAITQTADA